MVFVGGIGDISDLTEMLEGLPRFHIVPLHTDLPLEDQELALIPPAADEIKVILTTNIGASSLTFPECDTVICLGTCNAVRFYQDHSTNIATHSAHPSRISGGVHETMGHTWISQTDAIQRAGRTGRIRAGTVYRLYPQELFSRLPDHEVSPILQNPLPQVLLTVRTLLEDSANFEGVLPILEDIIESPLSVIDPHTLDKSFEKLFFAGMISEASDYGELTSYGKFAGQLPIEMPMARLISYGIALGVGLECVIIAASLLCKTPFRQASPLQHTNPDEFNAIVRSTFLGSLAMDQGVYSEPIMHLQVTPLSFNINLICTPPANINSIISSCIYR